MLVQSKITFDPEEESVITILPALPEEWQEGSVRGLRARGGFEVRELAWRDGKPTKLTILSLTGGDIKICYGERSWSYRSEAGKEISLPIE